MNIKLKRFGKKLGIKVKEDDCCHAEIYNNTIFLKKGCSDYDVAHEISHIICGWGCCREHCEWEAHGGAKVLCELFGVDKKQIEDAEDRMDCYAHRTNPIACGRFKKENSWIGEIKKRTGERKMTRIIKSIPTLKGKEANEFAKRMLDEEIKTLKEELEKEK